MNPNSVLESISKRFGLKKRDILSEEGDNLAVRMALAETEIINETKEWMEKQRFNLDFMDRERASCERSHTIIIVKNIPFKTNEQDIEELFARFGSVKRVMLPPNRALAVVEFEDEKFATNAFQNLSYYTFKHTPLYLEWAPIDLLDKSEVAKRQNEEMETEAHLSKILYIKNINFETTEDKLRQHFEAGNLGDIRSVKIVRMNGKSLGYGFIEFATDEAVSNALKKMQNSLLDEHAIKLSMAKAKQDDGKNKKTKKNRRADLEASNKILVRNVAFETTKKDIRELFKAFGELRAVRLPKKMNGSHR